MDPFYRDEWLTVWQGDCRTVLAALPDASVHCVVTSPPYWGLRDYGTASWQGGDPDHAHVGSVSRTPPAGSEKQASKRGSTDVRSGDCSCGALRVDDQLGLEPTPELYVERMVAVFREVRRVLRDDGTVWLNIGDSYNGSGLSGGRSVAEDRGELVYRGQRGAGSIEAGLKPKDLVGIPWRLAFALQADGWYLRRDIIWAKPNPMPESTRDRPTTAHEYLFLLAKSPRYFYDDVAVRERATYPDGPNSPSSIASPYGQGFSRRAAEGGSWHDHGDDLGRGQTQGNGGDRRRGYEATMDGTRSLRSVWNIATEPYPGAHFATFPRKLVEPCVKAGTSERGVCPDCGAPWVRVVERQASGAGRWAYHGEGVVPRHRGGAGRPGGYYPDEPVELGWRPSCRHGGAPDDYQVIRTPVGEGQGGDYHRARLTTARRGLDRERLDDEGVRPMYRWEQRDIARQLAASPRRSDMATEAGAAFAHYIRTDRSGARAVPPELLERWIAAGWIVWPAEMVEDAKEPVPATVLDPFGGSGTTGVVAQSLGRRAVLVDLNADYLVQALRRNQQVPMFLAAAAGEVANGLERELDLPDGLRVEWNTDPVLWHAEEGT